MTNWEKTFTEYVETGKVSVCPVCNERQVTTKGYVRGSRGSLDIKCEACGAWNHFDGFASMHDNADKNSIKNLNRPA